MKWFTKIEAIDIETGEVLDKKVIRKNYTILKKLKIKTTINNEEKYGTQNYRWYCEKNRQQPIEFTTH